MFIVSTSKRGTYQKFHGDGFLDMGIEDFLEGFDISEDQCIWWSTSPNALTNGLGFKVEDDDEYEIMISQLRTESLPRRVYFMSSSPPPDPVAESTMLVLICPILDPG